MLPVTLLEVLCFGDCLTAGFTRFGSVFHPYGWAMKAGLEKALPNKHTEVIIDLQGASGDRVISPPGQFLPRMKNLCE